MKKFLVSHIWWITLLLALAMLVAHTVSFDAIEVDNISIILLIVILLSPFTTAITKIKIGEFEAEVNPEEVRKIKEEVASRVKETDKTTEIPGIENTIGNISDLVRSDPVLALAKLRIELEKVLGKLYRITHNDKRRKRPLSAGQLAYRLANAGVLPPDIAGPTREVILICNRAIHGEDIRQQDAKSVVESGAVLLREISFAVQEYVLEPIESTQIDQATVDEFRNARYRVTTMVPLVDTPHKNTRIVDQQGLDELLEGYNEYAEFIVEVTRLGPEHQS
jgi:hypothetical protein